MKKQVRIFEIRCFEIEKLRSVFPKSRDEEDITIMRMRHMILPCFSNMDL